MNALPRRQRSARLAGPTLDLAGALALSLAGTALAGSRPAKARMLLPKPVRHAAVGWGDGGCGTLGNGIAISDKTAHVGQLGDGTTIDNGTPVQVAGLTNVTQVSAGAFSGLAVHTMPLLIQP